MNRLPKIYSYIRFSSPEQAKGHSLDRQMDYAKEYAEANDMLLDESLTMKDEGLSAYHKTHIKRGAFGIFLSAVESGKVPPGSVLIIEALDRMSRFEPIQAQAILSQIIMAGIAVVTASDGKIYERESIKKNPMDLVYSLLIFVRANEESETKSKRIKKTILDRISHWQIHGFGKPIRVGRDPAWVSFNDNTKKFNLVEEKAETVRHIINLYKQGLSYTKLTKYISEEKLPLFDKISDFQQICRLITDKRLTGEKTITIDSKIFTIEKYYPPILTYDEFFELQQAKKSRATTKSQCKVPSLFTGMRICYCGYCLNSMIAQNHMHRLKPGDNMLDCYRRIACSAKNRNLYTCPGSSSKSIFPVEKAILEYCSDMVELTEILKGKDKTQELIVKKSGLKQKSNEIVQKIENAESYFHELLASGEKVSPVLNSTIEKLRLEQEQIITEIADLEHQLHHEKQCKFSALIDEWKKVKDNAYNLDEDARLLIRQLVKRTLKRIDIFLHGLQLSDQPAMHLVKKSLGTDNNTIDLILTFHNDKTRILSIDKKTGSWIKGGDIDQQFSVESTLQGLAERQTSATEAPV